MPDPAEVFRLAATGLELEAIASQLRAPVDEVMEALTQELGKRRDAALNPEDERLVELAHLGLLRRALMPAAMRGDVAASRLLVRVSQQRSALLGLAADPEPTVTVGEEDELDRIRARRAARRSAEG